MQRYGADQIELLKAARLVANFASTQGVPPSYRVRRSTYDHAGALLADTVLQAGLNYRSVVRPRVDRILALFPHADTLGALVCIVKKGQTASLLDWSDPIKSERFERLVYFLRADTLDTAADIRKALLSEDFCEKLKELNGVGPKTIDYMACLVGIESIAVDRHIRSFALRAGVEEIEYRFLKWAFCFAADLLSISRREFDAWIWSTESRRKSAQLTLAL
jgi:hypothetical protein